MSFEPLRGGCQRERLFRDDVRTQTADAGAEIEQLYAAVIRRARCDECADPGTAADIIKIAMIRVAKRLKEEQLKTRLLLQVHDELLLEVPEDELEKAEQILEEEMTGAAHLAVKLEIDMHTGNNWYEAK